MAEEKGELVDAFTKVLDMTVDSLAHRLNIPWELANLIQNTLHDAITKKELQEADQAFLIRMNS